MALETEILSYQIRYFANSHYRNLISPFNFSSHHLIFESLDRICFGDLFPPLNRYLIYEKLVLDL